MSTHTEVMIRLVIIYGTYKTAAAAIKILLTSIRKSFKNNRGRC